jgi:spore coat polysaccharide biosynthesis predicted glycosyltransferase SpsG
MLKLRAVAPVLTLEDSGPGRQLANLSINALYEDGGKWAVLRPEFTSAPPYEVRRHGEKVLVTFGGTDPSGLTAKAIDALGHLRVRVIRPPTWPGHVPVSMASEMLQSDVVVCSAGRTLYEAAHLGVPAVVMAQNAREATHRHLNDGNVFLGLGRMVSSGKLRQTVELVLGDYEMRRDLSQRAVVDGRGLDRVVFEVERLARGL